MDQRHLSDGLYYKLRLRLADLQHFDQLVALQRRTLEILVQEALTAAGLDPTQQYQLEDAGCTVTLQPAQSAALQSAIQSALPAPTPVREFPRPVLPEPHIEAPQA